MIDRIIINGPGGSGKDTFINEFADVCKDKAPYLVVRNHSTIELPNKMIWGLSETRDKPKDVKMRNLIFRLKKALIEYDDLPFKRVIQQSSSYDRLDEAINLKRIMFIHCREGAEIRKMQKYFGDRCLTVFIRRDWIPVPNCPSDIEADNFFGFDFNVINCGRYRIRKRARILMELILYINETKNILDYYLKKEKWRLIK